VCRWEETYRAFAAIVTTQEAQSKGDLVGHRRHHSRRARTTSVARMIVACPEFTVGEIFDHIGGL